jgi:hypothetical protein
MLGYAIPQLEFLAIIAATILYRSTLAGSMAVLVTDSLTSRDVINNFGARCPETQWLHSELLRVLGGVPVFAETRHGYGETSPCADLASRGRLHELHDLCAQLDVQPVRLDLPEEFIDILHRFRVRFGPKFARPGAERAYLARQLETAAAAAAAPAGRTGPIPALPHDTELQEGRGGRLPPHRSRLSRCRRRWRPFSAAPRTAQPRRRRFTRRTADRRHPFSRWWEWRRPLSAAAGGVQTRWLRPTSSSCSRRNKAFSVHSQAALSAAVAGKYPFSAPQPRPHPPPPQRLRVRPLRSQH